MDQQIKWELLPPNTDAPGDIPHATHTGVFEILGHKLRCYRLSTGQTVFDASDFNAFLRDWLGDDADAFLGAKQPLPAPPDPLQPAPLNAPARK